MAVTPAGAEVAQAAATSWKKIWKKELKPLAAKTFYTKQQADTKYASKAEAAAAAAAAQSAATGAANSATDSKLGGYYKKAESDAKYAPYPSVIRGVYTYSMNTTASIYYTGSGISFGYVLPAAPTVTYVAPGALPPAACPGTAQRPDALPGNLCVFGATATNVQSVAITDRSGSIGKAEPFGAGLHFLPTANANMYAYGTWAVRPASVSTNTPPRVESKSGSGTTIR